MRAYHQSKRRPYPTVPSAVGRLPINLLRTALYPGRQAVVGNAAQAWQRYMAGAPQPTILPQSLAFQQWKTTPSGRRKYWASSAMSYMALSNQFQGQSGVPTRVARKLAPPPAHFPHAAAGMHYGGASMPMPVGPALPVLQRGIPPRPTQRILAGQTNIAAPFPRPDAFIETLQARAAQTAYHKIQRRNAAERGARVAVATREGMTR